MNKFDLKKRAAIVTGGAQGFGLDIAKRFLKFGARVIIWDNDENELKKLKKKIKSTRLAGRKCLSPAISEMRKFETLSGTQEGSHFL